MRRFAICNLHQILGSLIPEGMTWNEECTGNIKVLIGEFEKIGVK
jgi:hypothetical protein